VDAVAIELPPHVADYRRQSRRLRARFPSDSPHLYRHLQFLSRQSDAQAGGLSPASGSDPLERFTQQIARSLAGPILPYSQRLALLKQAGRQGIERFEANLMIAAVQHRVASRTIATHVPRRWSSLAGQFLFFLFIQAGILLGIWRIICR
jgi:hypothetical protein